MAETVTVMGCGACWRERGVFEPVIACVAVDEDVTGWFWWCRTCEAQTGWGVDGPKLRLGLIRDVGVNEANDFQVFDAPRVAE